MPDSPPPIVLPKHARSTPRERVLTGPYELYLRGNESLRLTSWNSLVGVTLKLQGRFLTSDNVWSELRESHTPNTDRTPKAQSYQVAGALISNLVLFADAGSPLVGQTFVKLELVQGDGNAATVLGVVLQGYVTSNGALAWPGSPIVNSLDGGGYQRIVTGTTPAAGNHVLETCPANAQWELTSIAVNYTADATVVTRYPYLRILDAAMSGTPVFPEPTTIVAGETWFLSWARDVLPAVTAPFKWVLQAMPSGRYLIAGQQFMVDTINIAAGDTFGSPAYTLREWIVP